MSDLKKAYDAVFTKIKAYNDAICDAISDGEKAVTFDNSDIDARIAEYTEQLRNIEQTLPQIEDLLLLSQKYVGHRNLPTIEAPEGYRVNIRRLKMWAQMIDPLPRDSLPEEDGDPYAQRVYMVATCDKFFLKKKYREFTNKINELEQRRKSADKELAAKAKERVETLKSELTAYLIGKEFRSFAENVTLSRKSHTYEKMPASYRNAMSTSGVALGEYGLDLPLPEGDLRKKVLRMLGPECYEEASSRVMLPYVLSETDEYAVSVFCETAKTAAMDAGLQSFLLDIIERSPAGANKIYVFDCARYKATALGPLRPLEDSFAVAAVPRSAGQVSAMIEKLSCEFDNVDELLESCDTLAEYNTKVSPDKRLPKTTVLLVGWPNSFQTHDRELIQRMMINHDRYGITFIAVNFMQPGDETKKLRAFPEYVNQNAVHIEMMPTGITVCDGEGVTYPFGWYPIGEELAPEYAASLLKHAPEKKELGNDYTKRFNMSTFMEYSRAYKPLVLPYGINGKDEVCSLSFENENFAAFLMGASRSGKSTLLHTLISGIIVNYHPDNLELWLADFKQLEFKKYMKHCPPHVKYILLDESTELVYDLIDKLTEKMMERQRLFAAWGIERIDQITKVRPELIREPMPMIFVILDEFSIMSQSVAESDIYKIRLQNLLAKGAALGIRFLFSSQTFTTGVTGLTKTARAQVQQRIAMKGRRDEIEETLELSATDKTERVRNWMNALPPHYALVKRSRGADQDPEVERVHVLFFSHAEARDNYIDAVNASMQASDVYRPDVNNAYVYKHPVMVDGNSYDAFDRTVIRAVLNNYRRTNSDSLSDNDLVVSLGIPRRMSGTEYVSLYSGSRENLLMIAPYSELACAMSVVWTVAESSRMQGAKVSVWAYSRNRLYKSYKDSHFSRCSISEGMDAVCDAIRELNKKIRTHSSGSEVIILLGMEQLCMDFEFYEGTSAGKKSRADAYLEQRKALENSNAVVHTDEEDQRRQVAQAWVKKRRELEKAYKAEGLASDEIKQKLRDDLKQFTAEPNLPRPAAAPDSAAKPAEEEKVEEVRTGAYNAKDDFIYCIKQGSRMGYRFMMLLSSVSDIKQCGLKMEFFQHKLGFQMSADDSRSLFGNKIASNLPERICQYDNGTDRYSFRPYLHKGIVWDGWMVDENGKAVSPLIET